MAMTVATRRRRRWPMWWVGGLVVLVALWCAYWYAANRVAASTIERVMASLSARGQNLTCVEQGLGGFPLTLDFNCRQAAYSGPNRTVSAALDRVDASAALYWPGLVTASATGPLDLETAAGGPALVASWTDASVNVEAGLSGLRRLAANLDGLKVEQKPGSQLPVAGLGAGHAAIAAGPAGDGDYRLGLVATGLQVKLPAGQELPVMSADLDVTAVQFGSALGRAPEETLRRWLRAGGVLKVERALVTFGDSSAGASGTLTLAESGLLSGTLTIRLTGLDRLPDTIAAFRPGLRKRVTEMVGMISAVAKPVKQADQTAYEIPLAIMNGTVTLGGIIPIAAIPAINL